MPVGKSAQLGGEGAKVKNLRTQCDVSRTGTIAQLGGWNRVEDAAVGVADFCDPDPFTVKAGGQRLQFFPAGHDRREAMLAMLDAARVSLKLVFYIFAEDAISTLVRDALVRAREQGVAVTLILDRFGSCATAQFLAPITDRGGMVHFASERWTLRYLIRNHQKMIIADDNTAMFGGFNIEDDYFAPPASNGWTDLAIKIDGSAVAGLVELFAKLERWTDGGRGRFRDVRRTVRQWDWSDGNARWLLGGPTRGLSKWADCVSRDLRDGAELDMFMAYFSPPPKLLRKIGKIARKGRTRLLMAAKSDNNVTLGATRSLYDYLLKHRAKIWEFTPCKLHTKLIVLDDAVYVGSANFDVRSLYINLEIVLQIRDAEFAHRMREFVSYHIAASEEITPAVQEKRATVWNRIRWNIAWVLVSVVDYTVSRRLNLGL